MDEVSSRHAWAGALLVYYHHPSNHPALMLVLVKALTRSQRHAGVGRMLLPWYCRRQPERFWDRTRAFLASPRALNFK